MSIDAQQIVEAIGQGVAAALRTNQFFLGLEEGAFKNADIHPEYVTTVEVGRALSHVDRIVSLETHMKQLRKGAYAHALLLNKAMRPTIDAKLARYTFGKKDSQRLDILVRSSDGRALPLLVAEAKLGVDNLTDVIKDIGRIIKLFDMYNDLDLLKSSFLYGAVVFHSLEEGNADGTPNQKAINLVKGIRAYLDGITQTRPWLNARADLLSHGAKVQEVVGYRETYMDGYEEDVFAKDSFTFAPGLVLLGNNSDVETAFDAKQ